MLLTHLLSADTTMPNPPELLYEKDFKLHFGVDPDQNLKKAYLKARAEFSQLTKEEIMQIFAWLDAEDYEVAHDDYLVVEFSLGKADQETS